jgi:hypothetical protein
VPSQQHRRHAARAASKVADDERSLPLGGLLLVATGLDGPIISTVPSLRQPRHHLRASPHKQRLEQAHVVPAHEQVVRHGVPTIDLVRPNTVRRHTAGPQGWVRSDSGVRHTITASSSFTLPQSAGDVRRRADTASFIAHVEPKPADTKKKERGYNTNARAYAILRTEPQVAANNPGKTVREQTTQATKRMRIKHHRSMRKLLERMKTLWRPASKHASVNERRRHRSESTTETEFEIGKTRRASNNHRQKAGKVILFVASGSTTFTVTARHHHR